MNGPVVNGLYRVARVVGFAALAACSSESGGVEPPGGLHEEDAAADTDASSPALEGGGLIEVEGGGLPECPDDGIPDVECTIAGRPPPLGSPCSGARCRWFLGAEGCAHVCKRADCATPPRWQRSCGE